MSSRTVFLDVDGTYVNDRGLVPASARRAVVQARANGHLVFLCTGRSTAMIREHVTEAGFDGLIASSGGYVEVGGAVLQQLTVPVEHLRHAVDFFDAQGVGFFLESTTGVYGTPESKVRLHRRLVGDITDEHTLAEVEAGLSGFIDRFVVDGDLLRTDINKLSFFDAALSVADVRDEFAGSFDVIPASVRRFGGNSGEMTIPGVTKALGIEVLLAHLGRSRQDTVAFGDGFNDVEMLQYVRTGVAMGGAPQEVLAVADLVTGAPDQDGIATGFRKTGLI